MNCYDTSHTSTATASAICSHCGAGLCTEHVHEHTEEIAHTSGMGSTSVEGPSGRRLFCATCLAAGTGKSHPRE